MRGEHVVSVNENRGNVDHLALRLVYARARQRPGGLTVSPHARFGTASGGGRKCGEKRRGVGRRAAPRTAGHPSRGRDTCGSEGQPPAAVAPVRWPPEGPAARILLPPVPLVVQAPARRSCRRPITARAPHGARDPAAVPPAPRRAGPARASAAAACAPSRHQARERRPRQPCVHVA